MEIGQINSVDSAVSDYNQYCTGYNGTKGYYTALVTWLVLFAFAAGIAFITWRWRR